ncbi:histidine phosphatase family protein [Aquimarina sp. U1-2]|uniref:SixA phosphatase family protein n=1 Tax=Aquimarina sp. U1-2 TaxID=2823141 RepID=UPI001AED0A41|nr:histidine phosphatase family protein [Aquimarina sp. U1-2]MBP2833886.1 histidine phosphatase family protein [Aquimarina sp. U1-2]
MKFIPLIFLLLISFTGNTQTDQKEKTTTYFFIRHAEKDLSDSKDRDPALTEKGKRRAQNWAVLFKDTKIDFVFSTDYTRTRDTAKPIAKSQDVDITLYDPKALNNPEFQEKTKGKTCVIVGHSNSTPNFVNRVMGQQKYTAIDESHYGKLFIVTTTDEIVTDIVLTVH